jgi:hypothetical protein
MHVVYTIQCVMYILDGAMVVSASWRSMCIYKHHAKICYISDNATIIIAHKLRPSRLSLLGGVAMGDCTYGEDHPHGRTPFPK